MPARIYSDSLETISTIWRQEALSICLECSLEGLQRDAPRVDTAQLVRRDSLRKMWIHKTPRLPGESAQPTVRTANQYVLLHGCLLSPRRREVNVLRHP